MEYTIVADSGKYKGCLVYVCGCNLEFANEVLDRLLNDPDERDLELRKEFTNFRIEAVEDKDCWWHDSLD